MTKAEQTFIARMLPHFMAGKSAEEAARSVLADDQRIMNEVFANNRRGVEHGAMTELSARVYAACRAA